MPRGRYLLDTHTLIWWWSGDPKLSSGARSLLQDQGRDVHVSAISAFEIALKVRAGRLPVMTDLLNSFDEAVAGDGFAHLPLTFNHTRRAGLLESLHRDPFDRLIAAQALIEGLVVVTRDREIAGFGCEVIW